MMHAFPAGWASSKRLAEPMAALARVSQHEPPKMKKGLPRKQKIGVKKCWVQKCVIGEEPPTILGVIFGGGGG